MYKYKYYSLIVHDTSNPHKLIKFLKKIRRPLLVKHSNKTPFISYKTSIENQQLSTILILSKIIKCVLFNYNLEYDNQVCSLQVYSTITIILILILIVLTCVYHHNLIFETPLISLFLSSVYNQNLIFLQILSAKYVLFASTFPYHLCSHVFYKHNCY